MTTVLSERVNQDLLREPRRELCTRQLGNHGNQQSGGECGGNCQTYFKIMRSFSIHMQIWADITSQSEIEHKMLKRNKRHLKKWSWNEDHLMRNPWQHSAWIMETTIMLESYSMVSFSSRLIYHMRWLPRHRYYSRSRRIREHRHPSGWWWQPSIRKHSKRPVIRHPSTPRGDFAIPSGKYWLRATTMQNSCASWSAFLSCEDLQIPDSYERLISC